MTTTMSWLSRRRLVLGLLVVSAALLGSLFGARPAAAMDPYTLRNQLRDNGACGTVNELPSHTGYAGLIVVLAAKLYATSNTVALQEPQPGVTANVSTYETADDKTKSPPGNVVQLSSNSSDISQGDRYIAGRYHDYDFSPRGSKPCKGQVVLTGQLGDGHWGIDCDASQRGVGNEQRITAKGSGRPTFNGQKLGAGHWEVSTPVRPPNGGHEVAITTYIEEPTTGWNLKGFSSVNDSSVDFDYETVSGYIAGLGAAPDKPESDDTPYFWNSPSDKRDCTDYTAGGTNEARCIALNKYNKLVYNASDTVRADNQTNVQTALKPVRFTHRVKNTGSNGQDTWVTAPTDAHQSKIQYKVNANVGSFGWTDRPANGDGNYGDWGPAIGKNSWPQHRASPTKVPLGDANLAAWLDNPQPGDKYCEDIYTHDNGTSTGGHDTSDQACVTLSNQKVCQGEPWGVDGYQTIKQTDGGGNPITGALGNSVTDAWVGEQYGFFYAFGNSGPADQTSDISYAANQALSPSQPGLVGVTGPNPNPGALTAPINSDAASLWWQTGRNSSRQIQALDGGRDYTISVHYSPTSGHWDSTDGDCDHGGAADTAQMKVSVPWYYQLRPQVDNDPPLIVQQGSSLQVDPLTQLNTKDDRGDGIDRYNTCAKQFNWDLTVTAQKPDTPTIKEPVSDSGTQTMDAWKICPDGNPGSAQSLGSGATVDTTHFPAGTKLCGHLEVWDSTESGGRASAEKCTIVVKQPKVQFWDSDVHVGRHFQQADNSPTCGEPLDSSPSAAITTVGPPTSVAGNNLYGSWVEYGAFASGAISSFGSAAQNKTGGFDVSPTGQRLTFGNDTQLGSVSYNNWCIPTYDKLFEPQQAQAEHMETLVGSTIDPSANHLSGDHYYTSQQTGTVHLRNLGAIAADQQDITLDVPNGNLVIDGAAIKSGVRLVIHVGGKVTINGNLTYNDSDGYATIGDIPRVVIIAGGLATTDDSPPPGLTPDLVVDEDVTQIDAWLIVHGTLFTCDTDPAGFDYHNKHCAKRLTVNGPVAAHDLRLRRTFGADLTDANDFDHNGPAEVFNLNPDSLLSSYSTAQKKDFTEVYQTDAPPRY